MKRLTTKITHSLIATAMTIGIATAPALAKSDNYNLKVVGTWGYLNQWKEVAMLYLTNPS